MNIMMFFSKKIKKIMPVNFLSYQMRLML